MEQYRQYVAGPVSLVLQNTILVATAAPDFSSFTPKVPFMRSYVKSLRLGEGGQQISKDPVVCQGAWDNHHGMVLKECNGNGQIGNGIKNYDMALPSPTVEFLRQLSNSAAASFV